MGRINSNVPSVVAQRALTVSQRDLARSLERLSTGLQINRGADNPAGLIVSERLRADIAAVTQAIDNSQRAINVIATTEGALNEVNALLIDIQGLIVEAANAGAFSEEEIDANQLQIDSAVESISRIATVTTFAGRSLLDGSLDYVLSGVNTTQLANTQVQAAKFGTKSFINVEVEVSQSALTAQLTLPGTGLSANGAVAVDIAGPNGIITLNFPGSATSVDIVDAINAQSDVTGVSASLADPTSMSGVNINSIAYGSDAFVRVEKVGTTGSFNVLDSSSVQVTRTEGVDAVATINGASTTANGLELSLNSSLLDVQVTLDTSFGAGQTTFAITGGGSLYQLGPEVTTAQQENIGIASVHANKLGNRIVGFLSELVSGQPNALRAGNFKQASDIINEVIDQISVLRGRLGAFERNTLRPNISQLEITSENLISAESVIRDTDFASETSELTRSQILVQAGTSVLAIANAQQQNVLTLLGG